MAANETIYRGVSNGTKFESPQARDSSSSRCSKIRATRQLNHAFLAFFVGPETPEDSSSGTIAVDDEPRAITDFARSSAQDGADAGSISRAFATVAGSADSTVQAWRSIIDETRDATSRYFDTKGASSGHKEEVGVLPTIDFHTFQ